MQDKVQDGVEACVCIHGIWVLEMKLRMHRIARRLLIPGAQIIGNETLSTIICSYIM